MKVILEKISRLLNYKFRRTDLLKTAITHRSMGPNNNERLEFLGDSILNFVIAEILFVKFPSAKEGELSRVRANLVNGETLADIARSMSLGDFLRLGPGELKSGGFRRSSILSDTVEALIGAMYLDGGLECARKFILQTYHDRLDKISNVKGLKDSKTQLQEYLQAKKHPVPEYSVESVEGQAHDQKFKVLCEINILSNVITGEGSSRRKAEQDAAAHALRILENATNND